MKLRMLLLISIAACWPAFAQQNNPPQRTITTRPDSAAYSDAKPTPAGTPSNVASAVEQYRAMWQKMTPEQHKAIVAAGGPTPDQYERMMMRAAGVKGASAANQPPAADSGHAADAFALDALGKSLQDLNAVRDANLFLVQQNGCAPELAARVADLKAKLRSDEFELNGSELPTAAPPTEAHTAAKANVTDPLAVASDWFNRPADSKQAGVPSDSSRTRESALLDAVLVGATAPAAPPRRTDAASPEAEQNKKRIEAEMARVRAELDQLSGACAAAKK
jgi:hypothetical protein